MRIAFTLMGGKDWTGGRNYLLNLVEALVKYEAGGVTPVIFYGSDVSEDEIRVFSKMVGVDLVQTPYLNKAERMKALLVSIILGCNFHIQRLFHHHSIDVVFEHAQFFGIRLNIPAIAWLPDFQHRKLPSFFSPLSRLKRELGFRLQIIAKRTLMISSEEARRDCISYYPSTYSRAHTVYFAVAPQAPFDLDYTQKVCADYDLPDHFFYLPNQFWVHKNHIVVVEALALLRAKGLSVTVVASGYEVDPRNPSFYARLCQKIEDFGLKDRFRLLGFIPYKHVRLLIQSSIGVINPSLFEGWSTTVEEARACGTPLILSDLAVHKEQLGHEAIYFERHSAQSLAHVLASFAPLSPQMREHRRQEALYITKRRREAFAKSFRDLAQWTLEASNR